MESLQNRNNSSCEFFENLTTYTRCMCSFFASVFKSSHTNYSFKDLPNENPTIQPKLGLEKPGESSSIWFNV